MIWTPDAVQRLRDMWPTSSTDEVMAAFPGVPAQYLRIKVSKLGIRRDPKLRKAQLMDCIGKAQAASAAREPYWNADRCAVVRDMFPTATRQDLLAALPGATFNAIRVQAARLGVHRDEAIVRAQRKASIRLALNSRVGKPAHNATPMVPVQCGHCGVSFRKRTADPRRFCSQTCSASRVGRVPSIAKETRTCDYCGKSVTRFKSQFVGKYATCGRGCWSKLAYRSSLELAVESVLAELGEPFIPQFQIGAIFTDFYLPNRKLIIECDGAYWHGTVEAKAKDHRRDWFLRRRGFRIARLAEADIKRDCASAVRNILGLLGRCEGIA